MILRFESDDLDLILTILISELFKCNSAVCPSCVSSISYMIGYSFIRKELISEFVFCEVESNACI